VLRCRRWLGIWPATRAGTRSRSKPQPFQKAELLKNVFVVPLNVTPAPVQLEAGGAALTFSDAASGPKCLTIATLGAHARVQSCSLAQENKRPSQSDILAGGAKGTRTPDLLVANETRYQLRHSPADRRADQHRDFTTVKPRRTCAFLRLRPPSQSLAPPPERRLSPAPPGSARTPQPDRKDQLCAQSAGPAASKHRSA
jgi:hypothetical protein